MIWPNMPTYDDGFANIGADVTGYSFRGFCMGPADNTAGSDGALFVTPGVPEVPALVRIHVVSTEYSEGREVKLQAVGSGAIITKDGFLITNHHVAGHAARIFCTLWNREEIEAELVGTDPLTDIAILRLKPDHPVEFKVAKQAQ